MVKNSCDGDVYIHNLTNFIKSHENQFANALVAYKKLNTKPQLQSNPDLTSSVSISNHSNSNINNNESTIDEETLTKEITRPVRLSLSLHHLYFILGKFQELGIPVGPMNLRFDTMDAEHNSNYVSFLSEFQRYKKIDSDSQSIHSISSVKSVMSSVSALWNTFNSASKVDNIMSDLKYIHSAFSKLPCLRLANDSKTKMIEGHEEYPFETATPIIIFKNVSILELCEIDPKEIYGWNILATKLRHLAIKKSNITDPIYIFVTLVELDASYRGEFDEYADSTDDLTTTHNDFDNDQEFNFDDNNLSKSKSNENKHSFDNNIHEKSPYRTPNSASTSNIPMSHSSISLSSNLNSNSNSNQKSHVSPNLHQSSTFASTHNQPYYQSSLSNYNYHHHYNHNHNYHYPLQSDTALNYSTSPTASFSSNYHPNRLYAEDIISQNPQTPTLSSSLHSTRRSYFYKNHNKFKRSRGSSSINNIKPNYEPYNNLEFSTLPDNNNINKKSENYYEGEQNEEYGSSHKKSNSNERPIFLEKSDSLSNKINIDENYWSLLKNLSLTENKIDKISLKSFDKLYNLVLLDLSYNKLTSIPSESLEKLTNLKTLNLSFNRLLTLDKFPKALAKLTVLKLRGNKLSNIDFISNLSALQKVDLRQNKLYKVSDLKPLLMLNKGKVLLQTLYLSGNPVSNSRGYRVELFNLFNGVDYSNFIKIDGSRPGIFESRMLLDEKTSSMRFKNYIDESIINQMTASVSNMNLNSILNQKTTAKNTHLETSISENLSQSNNVSGTFMPDSLHRKESSESNNHPILDQITTSLTLGSPILKNSSKTNQKITNEIEKNRNHYKSLESDSTGIIVKPSEVSPISNTFQPPAIPAKSELSQISPSPSIVSFRNPISVIHNTATDQSSNQTGIIIEPTTPLNRSVPHSQRASNDFSTSSSIITSGTTAANSDSNPIARLSLASPALPVITQATTTTMSVTNIQSSNERNSEKVSTPKLSSNIDYFGDNNRSDSNINKSENKENESNHISNEDPKLSSDDNFGSGLKISVV